MPDLFMDYRSTKKKKKSGERIYELKERHEPFHFNPNGIMEVSKCMSISTLALDPLNDLYDTWTICKKQWIINIYMHYARPLHIANSIKSITIRNWTDAIMVSVCEFLIYSMILGAKESIINNYYKILFFIAT